MSAGPARWLVVALVAAGSAVCVLAQAPTQAPTPAPTASAPQLTVLAPEDNAYVNGPTTLRAAVEPVDAASAIVFFVDGRQICVVTAAPFECEWDAGRSIAEHQIRVVATLVSGGREVKTLKTRGLGYVENIDVDVVQVTVTVTDGHGNFFPGLPLSAFHVFEDGHPQDVTHFSSENLPLELIVAVDISGSMASSMPKLKTAVKAFLGAVPAGDLVTLIGFNDTFFTLTRRATAAADRVKAVDCLAPWGATALYDVIIRGVEMVGRQPGRKALVVFTDGEDQGSHATIADVERHLQMSDVTLYMIGQGRGVTNTPLQSIMTRLATPTGGRALFTESIDQLHGAFSEVLNELTNQYLLGYQTTNGVRDGEWRQIKVEVDGHSDVRARTGYRMTPRK